MNYQHITLTGRATADAVSVDSKNSKTKFAKFSVAVNQYLGKERDAEVSFYDCLVFGGKNVENVVSKIAKGDLVTVMGRPKVEAYINKDQEPVGTLTVFTEDWHVHK